MLDLRFTQQDWERIERDTMAWWAGALDRPLVWLVASDPLAERPPHRYLSNYPLDMPADALLALYEPVLSATNFCGDAFPNLWINFGPGIMAGFLGSVVHSVTEPSETVWFSPPGNLPLEELVLDYQEANPWWRRVQEVTGAANRRWNGQVAVGHTDIGGNLDVLASLRTTQSLLYEVAERPDEVERLCRQITDLWLRYYDELDALIRPVCRGTTCWTPIWSTGKTYMLQSDFAYMISPDMFERFVVPDLAACCAHLDHGFYHLDGKGQIVHLDHLLSISRLRGIQWIPGDGQPSPDQWLPLLKRIRDGGKLCQVFVSPQGARNIVQNLGGRGFLLVIQHADPEFIDPERVQAFLDLLAREDISLHP
jgi:5-methyltetrahydrofolate--homocysteine methyltransferase